MTGSSSQPGTTLREALGGGVRTRLRTGWSLGWVRRRKSSCRPGTGRKCKKSSGASRRAPTARERSRLGHSPQGLTTTLTSKTNLIYFKDSKARKDLKQNVPKSPVLLNIKALHNKLKLQVFLPHKNIVLKKLPKPIPRSRIHQLHRHQVKTNPRSLK